MMHLTKKHLTRLIREEMVRRNGRPLLKEVSGSDIDWESEKGRVISTAVQELTFALIQYFVDDYESVDQYVPEVNNDIVACVEKAAAEYDWGSNYV